MLDGLGEALQVQRAPAARLGLWRNLREFRAGGMGTLLLAERAWHLVEEVFGPRPLRQWVLSFPHP